MNKKLTRAEWRRLKSSTKCVICDDEGHYEAPAHPLVGGEMKRIKCGCSYPDAHETGHYPERVLKRKEEA